MVTGFGDTKKRSEKQTFKGCGILEKGTVPRSYKRNTDVQKKQRPLWQQRCKTRDDYNVRPLRSQQKITGLICNERCFFNACTWHHHCREGEIFVPMCSVARASLRRAFGRCRRSHICCVAARLLSPVAGIAILRLLFCDWGRRIAQRPVQRGAESKAGAKTEGTVCYRYPAAWILNSSE